LICGVSNSLSLRRGVQSLYKSGIVKGEVMSKEQNVEECPSLPQDKLATMMNSITTAGCQKIKKTD
jgi:hypothetical protein